MITLHFVKFIISYKFSFFFKEKVRLRYKLTFDSGQESHDESGDVEQFPPPESWGNL